MLKKTSGEFKKKFFSSRLLLFAALLVLIGVAISFSKVTYKRYQLRKEIERLKTQIENLEKRNQEFSSLVEYLKSESFLEKEAREKLNLKKEGEEVVVMPPKIGEDRETNQGEINEKQATSTQEIPKTESNFLKWWRYFFRP